MVSKPGTTRRVLALVIVLAAAIQGAILLADVGAYYRDHDLAALEIGPEIRALARFAKGKESLTLLTTLEGDASAMLAFAVQFEITPTAVVSAGPYDLPAAVERLEQGAPLVLDVPAKAIRAELLRLIAATEVRYRIATEEGRFTVLLPEEDS